MFLTGPAVVVRLAIGCGPPTCLGDDESLPDVVNDRLRSLVGPLGNGGGDARCGAVFDTHAFAVDRRSADAYFGKSPHP